MVFIYTTCQNSEEARKIGKMIVEKKLAGCVNIWPIESIYFWEEKIREDNEAVLLIKTTESKVAEIENIILSNHSYAVPIIATIDIHRINREYKEWLMKWVG
ncbi:MAG: divalent-cation tolerance protein CutA [Patescibacteria group bacterium]